MASATLEERAMKLYRESPDHIQSRQQCQMLKLLVDEIQRLKAQLQSDKQNKSVT